MAEHTAGSLGSGPVMEWSWRIFRPLCGQRRCKIDRTGLAMLTYRLSLMIGLGPASNSANVKS